MFKQLFRIQKSKGVKSTEVYVISNLISRGLAIITVPIFTRLMSTSEIGVVNMYTSWFSILYISSSLSLSSGGFSLGMKEYKKARDKYISSLLTLTSVIALCFLLFFIIKSDFWSRVFGLHKNLIVLMNIGLLVSPAMDMWLARQRYEYKYKIPAAVMIFSAIVASIFSIIAVRFATTHGLDSATWRLFANYLVIYFVDAVLLVLQLGKGRTFFNLEYWKFSLNLSIPLLGYDIASQILNVSDRFMIDKMVGKSAVGIYSTLYTVGALSLILWNSMNSSFIPFLFNNIDKDENRIKKVSNSIIDLYACIAVCATFLAPEIVRILATQEYYESIYIMPPIAAGVFYIAVANLYSNILVYYKKTTFIMIASATAAILNIFLNYTFIPIYGYMAAAYTTLLSYILMAILEVFWSKKVVASFRKDNRTEPYDDKHILVTCIFTTGLCMAAIIFYNFILLRYLILFVIVFIFAIILKREISKAQSNNVKSV